MIKFSMEITEVKYSSYKESVKQAFDTIKAKKILSSQTKVLIKPNLVNSDPHPVTTPVECCIAIIDYIRTCSKADIVVAEGCGDNSRETSEVFELLGYDKMAETYGIQLIDLNECALTTRKNPLCKFFPKIYLPKIAFTYYIISVPVLKAHSLSVITGSLKNMIGFAPPKYYSGSYGVWKKSVFHKDIHQAIIELNNYRTPDLTLMDASIGLADYHLGGRRCTPHVNKIIAGYNPVKVDRKAAELLGLNWKTISHLQ